MKFVPRVQGPIYNIPALVQIMAWRRPGDKPLSEPMMDSLPTHICVTRPQWVNISVSHVFIISLFSVFTFHISCAVLSLATFNGHHEGHSEYLHSKWEPNTSSNMPYICIYTYYHHVQALKNSLIKIEWKSNVFMFVYIVNLRSILGWFRQIGSITCWETVWNMIYD